MTILKAPAGASSCFAGGVEYAVVGGLVDVPAVFIDSLLPFGFVPAPPAPPVQQAAQAAAEVDDEDSDAPAIDPEKMTRVELFTFLTARNVTWVGGNSVSNLDLRRMVAGELAADAQKAIDDAAAVAKKADDDAAAAKAETDAAAAAAVTAAAAPASGAQPAAAAPAASTFAAPQSGN